MKKNNDLWKARKLVRERQGEVDFYTTICANPSAHPMSHQHLERLKKLLEDAQIELTKVENAL